MAKSFDIDIQHEEDQGRVVLPCGPEEFREFIAGILGRPQELTGRRAGRFKIDLPAALQLHRLISQRVYQQHGVQPLRFGARILFENGTSVLLNSVEDFEQYHEVRAVASLGLIMSWTILVHFQGAESPQKQEIEIHFLANDRTMRQNWESGEFTFPRESGRVYYRIMHTARTWGADIEALLTHYLDDLIEKETAVRQFLREKSMMIGALAGILTFLLIVTGISSSASAVAAERISMIAPALGESVPLALKLDLLIRYIEASSTTTGRLHGPILLAVSMLISAIVGFVTAEAVGDRRSADVVLTRKAQERFEANERQHKRSLRTLVLSIAGSLVLGIVVNAIYEFSIRNEIQKQLTSTSTTNPR